MAAWRHLSAGGNGWRRIWRNVIVLKRRGPHGGAGQHNGQLAAVSALAARGALADIGGCISVIGVAAGMAGGCIGGGWLNRRGGIGGVAASQ